MNNQAETGDSCRIQIPGNYQAPQMTKLAAAGNEKAV
jgi:hypothetical protein